MNVIEIINKKVLESLENNNIPSWVCPYRRNGLPKNIDERNYHGLNVLLLSSMNFPSNIFLTYNQARKKGGWVKEGEKALFVVGYFPVGGKSETGDGDPDTNNESSRQKFMLRYFNVFNLSQTTLYDPEKENHHIEIADEKLNQFINRVENSICEIKFDSSEIPCYVPKDHYIKMPPKSHFNNIDEFYTTLFHEIIHSTLKHLPERKKLDYDHEELVAELGCSMLCQEFGIIQQIDNSAAYIANWSKFIKDNVKALTRCAGLAHKAFNFLIESPKKEK